MRRIKPFTIYPPAEIRAKLDVIGEKSDRAAGRVAVRFIARGIERWERSQQQRRPRQSA